MTLTEFRAHLDAYGGDLARWPPSLAEIAVTLLAESEAAQDLFAAAAALDIAFEDAREAPPSQK